MTMYPWDPWTLESSDSQTQHFCTICYGLVWFGMVWYGLVWFGIVWYGLVWFSIVWIGMWGQGGYQMNIEFIGEEASMIFTSENCHG